MREEVKEWLCSNTPLTVNQSSTLGGLILDTESNTSDNGHRGHEVQHADRTLMSVHATLSSGRRCNPSCMCQCHKGSQTGTPAFLSSVLGSVLIWYNGIPYWKPRTCNHPKCQRKSPTQVRLNYLFPPWMLRKGIHVSLSWGSVTGSGASLHLAVPRVIGSNNGVWEAIMLKKLPWLRAMVRARKIFPTDVGPDGLSLLMVSVIIISRHCPCLTNYIVACH